MVNHKNLSVLVSHYDKIIVLLRFDGLVIVTQYEVSSFFENT